jgi:hypothetical protein
MMNWWWVYRRNLSSWNVYLCSKFVMTLWAFVEMVWRFIFFGWCEECMCILVSFTGWPLV